MMEEESAASVGLRQRLKPISTKRSGVEVEVEVDVDVVAGAEEPLSPGARMFHEKDFNIHVLAIMGSKTKVDIHTVKANFPGTLLRHPRFSSIVVGDANKGEKLKWVRVANLNPEDHIVVPQIEVAGAEAEANGDKYVEDYIYNLSKTSLDRSKPLWDVHILNIKSSQAEATTVLRIHHSLGDGTSLMSLLLACTRQTANPSALPTVPTARRSSSSSPNRSRWSWRPLLAAASLLLHICWNTTVDVIMFLATSFFLKDTLTPLKGGPGVEYTPRRVVFRTVSLDDFKLIKNAVHGTINDAALAITQAGLSRYLNRKYGDETKNNLPKNTRLRSTLLINLRPSAGIQALADMMEKKTQAKWGNWIGFVLLPFTIGLRDDPMDYIREAKATVDRKKRSLEALYTFTISEIALKLFGVKVSGAMSHRVIAHTTMCFSNLVGPVEEIGFYGHPMQFLAPSSYGQPHALMINYQSYVDKMTIVLSVDEDTIPDARQLCDDIVECLRVIKERVVAKGLA